MAKKKSSRGRKPKPTALKVFEGNPGKRAIKSEPKPKAKAPSCPSWLDKDAKAEWKRVCSELVAMGVVTAIDRATLAGYCEAFSRWKQAVQTVQELGQYWVNEKFDSAGNHIIMHKRHPAVGIASEALRDMRSMASELGITPASRTRLYNEPDELDDFDAWQKEVGR